MAEQLSIEVDEIFLHMEQQKQQQQHGQAPSFALGLVKMWWLYYLLTKKHDFNMKENELDVLRITVSNFCKLWNQIANRKLLNVN